MRASLPRATLRRSRMASQRARPTCQLRRAGCCAHRSSVDAHSFALAAGRPCAASRSLCGRSDAGARASAIAAGVGARARFWRRHRHGRARLRRPVCGARRRDDGVVAGAQCASRRNQCNQFRQRLVEQGGSDERLALTRSSSSSLCFLSSSFFLLLRCSPQRPSEQPRDLFSGRAKNVVESDV